MFVKCRWGIIILLEKVRINLMLERVLFRSYDLETLKIRIFWVHMFLYAIKKNQSLDCLTRKPKIQSQNLQSCSKKTHIFFLGRLVICPLVPGANLLKTLERGFEVAARQVPISPASQYINSSKYQPKTLEMHIKGWGRNDTYNCFH